MFYIWHKKLHITITITLVKLFFCLSFWYLEQEYKQSIHNKRKLALSTIPIFVTSYTFDQKLWKKHDWTLLNNLNQILSYEFDTFRLHNISLYFQMQNIFTSFHLLLNSGTNIANQIFSMNWATVKYKHTKFSKSFTKKGVKHGVKCIWVK